MRGHTLCKDLPKVNFVGTTSIKRKAEEAAMAAAHRWLKEQANGWCEDGLCSNGKCEGVLSKVRIKVLSETADAAKIEFDVDIACECPPTKNK